MFSGLRARAVSLDQIKSGNAPSPTAPAAVAESLMKLRRFVATCDLRVQTFLMAGFLCLPRVENRLFTRRRDSPDRPIREFLKVGFGSGLVPGERLARRDRERTVREPFAHGLRDVPAHETRGVADRRNPNGHVAPRANLLLGEQA